MQCPVKFHAVPGLVPRPSPKAHVRGGSGNETACSSLGLGSERASVIMCMHEMMQSTTMAASVPSSSGNFMANGESERGPPGQRPLSPVVSPPLPVPDADNEREDTSREVIEDAIPGRSTSPESPEARDQGIVAALGPPNALLLW